MSTSEKQKLTSSNTTQSKRLSTKLGRSTLMKWLNLKAALMGLLMLSVAITSGCASELKPLVQQPPIQTSVSQQLMEKPSLTTEMLKVLSE